MRNWMQTALGAAGFATALGLALMPGEVLGREQTSTLRIPLGFDRTDLTGGEAAAEAEVHLPPGLAIQNARLVVGYANALGADPRFSTLEVTADGRPLVRLPLVGAQEPIAAEIDVPNRLITRGRLDLRLVARQRHRALCSREAYEQLWVRLDPEPSMLELEVAGAPAPPSLAGLPALLGNSLIDRRTLQIATTRPIDDPDVLAWGGLAAEAVALRRPDRPLAIRHVRLSKTPGQDAVALAGSGPVIFAGTLQELRSMLPDELPAGAGAGLVALLAPQPGAAPGTFALLATGRDSKAVEAALQAVATPRAWPQAQLASISSLEPPDTVSADSSGPVSEGEFALSALGYTSREVPLGFTGTLEVPFTMPEASYAGDGQRLQMHLDFAYGSGLAPTSALMIRVNGAPWNRVRLDDPNGGIVENATIDLPMGLFPPGPNVIGFEPVLHPATPGLCATVGDQPMFTLFEDSRIEVPPFARLAHQPDLNLFGATAFPYGDPAEGLDLVLGAADPTTVSAAWMLRGQLAAARGQSLPKVQTSLEASPTGRNLIVIGAVPDLPTAIVGEAPVPLLFLAERRTAGGDGQPQATAAELARDRTRSSWQQRLGINAPAPSRDWIGRLADRIIGAARAVPRATEQQAPSFEALYPGDERARAGTIVAFQSPFARARTATVVTAASRPALAGAVNQLVRPAVWDRLDGDLTVWTPDASSVRSRRVAPTFLASPLDWSLDQLLLLGRAHFARNPTHWLVLVFGMLALLAAATALALNRKSGT